MSKELLYVARPDGPVHHCGRCFRGVIRRYTQRCKVCGRRNIAFALCPVEKKRTVFSFMGEDLVLH